MDPRMFVRSNNIISSEDGHHMSYSLTKITVALLKH